MRRGAASRSVHVGPRRIDLEQLENIEWFAAEVTIGGSGERKTLQLVAQYADACNLVGQPNVVGHKLDVLRGHCDDAGTD